MKKIAFALAVASASLAVPATAAVTVNANAVTAGTAVSLGSVVAGKTYRITATGIIDLVNGVIPNGPFNVDPNGKPTSTVAPPYEAFNPDGSKVTYDGLTPPLTSSNFGSLIGSIGRTESLFFIGSDNTFTFQTGGELFARINDINQNNSGSFDVTVAAVPEPATWGMMILGFGVAGTALRRRAKVRTTVAYA